MMFGIVVAIVAMLAGGVASVAGFGIGSILTPLIASQYGMKTAVGAVSIPHVIATLLRFWRLRRDVDRHVLLGFGLMNAGGALPGALFTQLVAVQSTWERMKTASATPGAVAVNELLQAEKAVDAAQALVRAQEDSARAARSSVEALRELEGYLKVKAPLDGVITDRFVHPGALVGPAAVSSGPMLRLEQNTRLRLVAAVPEAEVGGIIPGAHVPFTAPAYPEETFSGVVVRIAHSMDLKTRSMAVELDVLNPGLRLAPGMYPEVLWPVRRPRPSLLVPPSSVVTTTERSFVIRVRGGRAEYVNVTRGAPAGGLVEVYGPLSPGDEIARRGSDEIREGAPLLRVEAQTP